MNRDTRRFLALGLAGVLLFGLYLYVQAIPQRIQRGLQAQEANHLLDALRVPLLELQRQRLQFPQAAPARSTLDTACSALLDATAYDPDLAAITGEFDLLARHWLELPPGTDPAVQMQTFLDLLEALARAEPPIHADLAAGQQAEARLWLASALLIASLLLLFLLYQRHQRRRAERAEQRSRAVIDQSPFAIQIFAPDGTPLHMNRTAERLWRIRLEDTRGYNPLTDPQLEALGITPYLRRAFAGEAVTTPVIRYDTSQTPLAAAAPHKVVELRSHIYPVRDSQGEVAEIIVMHEDVSELQEISRRLTEAQRVARLGAWELDLRTDQLYWSDEIFRIFEIDPARFGASYEAFLETVHPDDREAVNDAYVRSVDARTEYDIQHRLRMPDGRIKWVRERGHTEYAADGTPVRSLGTVLDITDYKTLEAELVRHREHLEEMVAQRTGELEIINAELESFSYSVSHDLRAPLRAITGFSRALAEDCAEQLDDTGRQYLERIEANVRRMTQLIDDLLTLSRTSQAPLSQAAVPLGPLADEVAEQLRQRYPDHPVEFVNRVTDTVFGDPKLLRILLENLLDNAWKYTGTVAAPRVVFSREGEEPGRLRFCLCDNGVGFDMAYADKLFGAFQRLHGSEFPGTGIGLATVQRIVHRHRGRIRGEGRPGAGACFRFTLPLAPQD